MMKHFRHRKTLRHQKLFNLRPSVGISVLPHLAIEGQLRVEIPSHLHIHHIGRSAVNEDEVGLDVRVVRRYLRLSKTGHLPFTFQLEEIPYDLVVARHP